MKYYFLLFISLTCLHSHAQHRNDLAIHQLKGPVKKVVELQYKVSGGKQTPNGRSIMCFNEKGYFTESKNCNWSETVCDSTSYVYSPDGRLQETLEYKGSALVARTAYSYTADSTFYTFYNYYNIDFVDSTTEGYRTDTYMPNIDDNVEPGPKNSIKHLRRNKDREGNWQIEDLYMNGIHYLLKRTIIYY